MKGYGVKDRVVAPCSGFTPRAVCVIPDDVIIILYQGKDVLINVFVYLEACK
jgi:hypothetical protein